MKSPNSLFTNKNASLLIGTAFGISLLAVARKYDNLDYLSLPICRIVTARVDTLMGDEEPTDGGKR